MKALNNKTQYFVSFFKFNFLTQTKHYFSVFFFDKVKDWLIVFISSVYYAVSETKWHIYCKSGIRIK